jgi:hypothetical protein
MAWIVETAAGNCLKSFDNDRHANVFAASAVAAENREASAEVLRFHLEELRRITEGRSGGRWLATVLSGRQPY